MDPEIRALHTAWEREFHNTEFNWAELQGRLHEAASPYQGGRDKQSVSGQAGLQRKSAERLNVIAVADSRCPVG